MVSRFRPHIDICAGASRVLLYMIPIVLCAMFQSSCTVCFASTCPGNSVELVKLGTLYYVMLLCLSRVHSINVFP